MSRLLTKCCERHPACQKSRHDVFSSAEVKNDRKAAPWKVAVAAQLKSVSTATNVWLAEQLSMGAPDGVSRYVSKLRRGERQDAKKLKRKITNIRV